MMIAALFALAFTLAMGQAGMLSFGHAAYYGLGAFAALHLMRAVEQKLFGFPTPLIPLAGALAGFVFGLAFGWFATQRTGVYFSMVTLALAELLLTLAPTWNAVFGGESGISTMRGPSWGVSFGVRCRRLLSDARLVRGVRLVHVGVHENTGRHGLRWPCATTSSACASWASMRTSLAR